MSYYKLTSNRDKDSEACRGGTEVTLEIHELRDDSEVYHDRRLVFTISRFWMFSLVWYGMVWYSRVTTFAVASHLPNVLKKNAGREGHQWLGLNIQDTTKKKILYFE